MKGWQEISDFVLQYDYCCGCGVCAGVCPVKALEMRFNAYGEYNPHLVGNCVDCGLCAKVCPFVRGNANEDDIGKAKFGEIPGIRNSSEVGYYLESYVGYTTDTRIRWNSASGGLVTWTLSALLKRGDIDYAVCVKPVRERGKLFEFAICGTAEELRRCSRSCYYPVELSSVVSKVLSKPGRYAVVGLPCALKALRRAEELNDKLENRIRYHLGLVCGQQKSAFFAEYVCALGGSDPEYLDSVEFRVKDEHRPASDYGLRFRWCDPRGNCQSAVVHWTEGMGKAWCEGYFKLNACNYCDDLFAEVADVAYMDAWLPEYSSDSAGTSIVLLRNKELLKCLRQGNESGEVQLEELNHDQVVRSQQGALKAKRKGLAVRLAFAQKKGLVPPRKRVEATQKITVLEYLGLRLESARTEISKEAFRTYRERFQRLGFFNLKIRLSTAPFSLPIRLAGLTKRFGRRLGLARRQ